VLIDEVIGEDEGGSEGVREVFFDVLGSMLFEEIGDGINEVGHMMTELVQHGEGLAGRRDHDVDGDPLALLVVASGDTARGGVVSRGEWHDVENEVVGDGCGGVKSHSFDDVWWQRRDGGLREPGEDRRGESASGCH
jgi:hypothetical protein